MNKTRLISALALIAFFSFGFSNPEYPAKYPGNYNLFKIDRSRDPDIVMYDVNLDSQGKLDAANPITVYWIKKTKNSQMESLTEIQKKFGYGLRIYNISDYSADFEFVSHFKRNFELRKSHDNSYRVYIYLKGKRIEIQRMYIQFENDSFWFPDVSKVEIHGIETIKGDLVSEIIIR